MNQEIKQKMDAWTRELNLDFGEPMTENEIREMEKKLDLEVPEEYKEFLLNYGCIPSLDILGSVIPGDRDALLSSGEYLWSSLGITLRERRSEYTKIPHDLIVIRFPGNGILDCIVGKGERFGQVVYWDPYCDPEQAYPNTPNEEWFQKNPDWFNKHINGKKEDFWLAGYNFWDYLFREFQRIKEVNKEVRHNLPHNSVASKKYSDFFECPVKGKGTDENYPNDIPEAVVFESPLFTKGNLKAMAQKTAGVRNYTKIPRGNNKLPMELYYWRRKKEGPLYLMTQDTYKEYFSRLYPYQPSKIIEDRNKFDREKDQLNEFMLRQYLGDWADSFIEVVKEEDNAKNNKE